MTTESKTITNYHLNEAIQAVQEMVLDGWRVNMMDTYRLGTINQIVMVKTLTEVESDLKEVQELEDWVDASSVMKEMKEILEADDNDTRSTDDNISSSDSSSDVGGSDVTDTGGSTDEEEDKEKEVSLADMDIHQLRAYAKSNGVKIHHKMTKLEKIRDKIFEELKNNE